MLPWSALVHQQLATIATFAYSQSALAKMRNENFVGEWKFLTKVIHDIPSHEAKRACLEFGLYLRALDDQEGLTEYWKQVGNRPVVGTLYLKSGKTEPLSPREMSNKIIHAERLEWDFSGEPKIICVGWKKDDEKWLRAEIDVRAMLAVGGMLGS
jgi:hypothetical protein